MSILTVSLKHEFQTGFALDIALSTEAGVTALFGPSGSGKSTLLNIMGGLDHASSGHLFFKNVELTTLASLFPLRIRIGWLKSRTCVFLQLQALSLVAPCPL